MKTKHLILRFLLLTVLTNGYFYYQPVPVEAETNTQEIKINNNVPAFSERGKPRALNLYWHRMAQCETGGDWKDKGKWSGGLGIYTQTWINFGGLEFAKKPELATVEEQITVANRISTQGYQTKNEFITLKDKLTKKPFFRDAVGFGGWGCKKNVGNPVLFKKFPTKILFREYKLGDKNKYVYQIQKIIGVGVDGYFGPVTDKYYNKFFTKYRHVIMAEYRKYNPFQIPSIETP